MRKFIVYVYIVCVVCVTVCSDHVPDLTAFQQSPSLPAPSSRPRLCQAARRAGVADRVTLKPLL